MQRHNVCNRSFSEYVREKVRQMYGYWAATSMITELLIAYFSEFKNTVFAKLDALVLYFFKAKCEGAYISEGLIYRGGGGVFWFLKAAFSGSLVKRRGGGEGSCNSADRAPIFAVCDPGSAQHMQR